MSASIRIFADKQTLCYQAAEYWFARYTETMKANLEFHIALSGGSTPRLLHQHLASTEFSSRIHWENVHIYFGDERMVPHDHVDSNYLMARETLLDAVAIPSQNIHPVPYYPDNPSQGATEYQDTLSKSTGMSQHNGIPQLDLILLGMGDDGHTASLFPGTDILVETERWVAEVYVEKLKAWRVSFTYPLINNAKNVAIIVAGGSKSEILVPILDQTEVDSVYPIQHVKPVGDIIWMLDEAAAKAIKQAGISQELTAS